MSQKNYRTILFFLALLSFVVLGSSFHFQYVVGLQPCPLCLMQRLCVLLLLIIILFSFFAVRTRLWLILHMSLASFGLFFALRHLWLQSLPLGKAPACMPGLDVLIRYFPWQTVAKALFWGAGDCAETNWSWLGISMPGWSALYFLLMLISGLWLFWRLRKRVY